MDQRYQFGTSQGSFFWNITAMLPELDQYPVREFDAATLAATNPFHGDEDYAMTTDLAIPLVVVELKPGFDKLIDGNHRLFKALALHRPTVRAYYLTESQHKKYIENFDETAYQQIMSLL